MESVPSANLRQQKLDHQRRIIEEKQRKKRQQQVLYNYFISLSIEKARAGDFVTILWGASMENITKLAMPQSQKPRSPLPQIIM